MHLIDINKNKTKINDNMLSKGQRPKAQASGLLRYTNKAHSDPLESALVYFPLVL